MDHGFVLNDYQSAKNLRVVKGLLVKERKRHAFRCIKKMREKVLNSVFVVEPMGI